AYIADHVNHADRPFLYEMVPFALLMKLGLIGFCIYLLFIFYPIYRLLISFKSLEVDKLILMAGIVAFLIQIHTNPVFFSFTGMLIYSFFLWCWLVIENQKRLP
ncbi:hypothetical protein ACQV5M_18830, partial [Leptospira sp. SA-E8]|uniref:hypothetical protein n=1 Tax=Leptospira sp. SA-E8 TaxID=3422259 RepID=UPI003EBCBC63